MRKAVWYLIVLTTLLSFSSCSSKKGTSEQLVMANVAPTTVATPESTVTPQSTPTPTLTASPDKGNTPTPKETAVTPVPTVIPTAAPSPIVSPTPEPQATSTPAAETVPLVVIDGGHGGKDPGTNGFGLVEKDVTLDIAKKLNDVLTKNGIKTYMVRTTDVFIDHRDRIYAANDMKASLYVSIHCDWFDNSKYGGTQTFYTTAKDLRLVDLTELQYAKAVHTELINSIKSNDRGITDRPTLAVLKYATMPSILIETGFLSNPTDAANLATSEYRQKIADGIASGISISLKKANLSSK